MSTKLGTCVKMTIDDKLFVGELSSNMATAVNLIELSSKESCRASNFEYGRVSESASVSSIATTDGAATTENWKDAQAAAVAGTKVAIVITELDEAGADVVGAIKITGSALLSNVTLDIPDNDKLTFGCDLQFDGATIISVNAAD